MPSEEGGGGGYSISGGTPLRGRSSQWGTLAGLLSTRWRLINPVDLSPVEPIYSKVGAEDMVQDAF